MEAIEAFGPKLVALMVLVAVAYGLLSFAPLWWPAIVASRSRPSLPRRGLFVGVVAALVYGVFSFLAFAIILPVEVYGIFVAPQLELSGVAAGAPLLRATGFVTDYWWLLIPPIQLALTWYVTRKLKAKWAHRSGGVTVEMLDCIGRELEIQDAMLNAAYRDLGAQLSPARKQQLTAAQRLWIQYRDANCGFYADPDGGTLATVASNECVLRETSERAKELKLLGSGG